MNLSVLERYALLELLPGTGSFATIKMIRKLREKLEFSAADIEKYQLKETLDEKTGSIMVTWDRTVGPTAIEFNGVELALIVTQLKRKSENDQLNDREFSLYEKFVGDE